MSLEQDVTATTDCPHCGRRVGDARFCTHCGGSLQSDAADTGAQHRPDSAAEPSTGERPAGPAVVACVRCGGANAASRQQCGRCGGDLTGRGPDGGAAATPMATSPAGATVARPEQEARAAPARPAPAGTSAPPPADDGPGLPGVLVIVTVVLLAVSGAVALTLLSARGVGPFAGPAADDAPASEAGTVAIAEVTASSALEPEGATTYGPDNLIDDDPTTAWNEAEPGDGEGEWIEVQLTEPTVVTSVVVWNGYQAGDFFARHNRVRRLRLELDGRTFAVRLLDRRGAQSITLPERIATERVRLTVAGTFPGTVYNDTALSELSVRGVPQDPAAGGAG